MSDADKFVTILRTQYDDLVAAQAEAVRLRAILQGTMNGLRAAGMNGSADEIADALEHEFGDVDWRQRFADLYVAVAACEAPEGTQVDDVLAEYQADYKLTAKESV